MRKRTMWGLVVLGACTAGGAADDMAGELMSDAGRMLVDAGNAMGSMGDGAAGGADAQLPPPPLPREPMTLKCDVERGYKWTRTNPDTGMVDLITENVYYYAEVELDNIDRVNVVLCDHEVVSEVEPPPPDTPACPANYVCEGDTNLLPARDCIVGSPSFEAGKMYVLCGSGGYYWTSDDEGVSERTTLDRRNQVKVIFL
jgi:hypothetical protein